MLVKRRLVGEVPGSDMTRIDRVRRLCLALPEAFELEAWDHPTFRVGSGRGKMFCVAAGDGSSISLKADPAEREALLAHTWDDDLLRWELRAHDEGCPLVALNAAAVEASLSS